MNKKELRREVLVRRNELLESDRKEKSGSIAEKVIDLQEFRESNTVLLYNSIRSEVETMDIIQEANRLGKNIYLPRVMGDKMEFFLMSEKTEYEISKYGICEPIPESTDVYVPKGEDEVFVLVPGAVFDEVGNRIGYGGGYYDKYLKSFIDRKRYKKMCVVAVAYDCQIVGLKEIENESHDVKMDYVITESREMRRMR